MKPHPDPTQVLKEFILGERDTDDPLIEEYSRTQPGFREDVHAFLDDENRVREAGVFRAIPPVTEMEAERGTALVRDLINPSPTDGGESSATRGPYLSRAPGAQASAPTTTRVFWFRIAAALLVSASLLTLALQNGSDSQGPSDVAIDERIDTSEFMLGTEDNAGDPAAILAPKGSIVSDMPPELAGPLEELRAKTDGTEAPGDDFVFHIFMVGETQALIASRPQRAATWTLGGLDKRRLGELTQIEWSVTWTSSEDSQIRTSARQLISFTRQ